ncbi:MAG: glycosyltransferase family 2 protein [Bacteroidota bacterium]|nr:glycosyltransferase family 2 protein [Bacteroidota bacterium]
MVSIIICTYNRAALLPRAIQSVLKQTFADWELIVVDDGSTDNSHEIVLNFLSNDSRIKYFYHHNRGLAEARNVGLRLALGEYITFLDSDDEYAPHHIAKRQTYLTKHASVGMIHGGAKLIGPKGKRYVVDLTNPKKKIHLRNCHIGGTFFFRRKIAAKVRGFRSIKFGEDFDFYRRVKRYFTIAKVNFPTYLYHLDVEDRLCDVFTEALHNKD